MLLLTFVQLFVLTCHCSPLPVLLRCCWCERSGSGCPEQWRIAKCRLNPRLGRWLLPWRWWPPLCLAPHSAPWHTPPQETRERYRFHPQCGHRWWLTSVTEKQRNKTLHNYTTALVFTGELFLSESVDMQIKTWWCNITKWHHAINIGSSICLVTVVTNQ